MAAHRALADAWRPDDDAVTNLVQTLAASMHAHADNAQHRALHNQLQHYANAVPDFNCYLAHIFAHAREQPPMLRQVAGLLLKNNLRGLGAHGGATAAPAAAVAGYAQLPPMVQHYVRAALLRAVVDSEAFLRATAGSCITTIITAAGSLRAWPELVPTLLAALDLPDACAMDGALSALAKLCEDSAEVLAADGGGAAAPPSLHAPPSAPPLDALIPRLIALLGHEREAVRRNAIAALSHFVRLMPEALRTNMDAYLGATDAIKLDPSAEVRRYVCQALVHLLEVQLERLRPSMAVIVDYMLRATADDDELVALEACEFWAALAETRIAEEALDGALPSVVRVLLRSMVYSEEELLTLEADDDADRPDRPEDMKPRFHRSKLAGGGGGGSGGGGGQGMGGDFAPGGQSSDADDADADADDAAAADDDDDEVSEWNLRKCSASGLDTLANRFGAGILPTLLPLLQERLASPEWAVRESGILALGAIADGCTEPISAYLPQLVPWLIETLGHPKALVRSIACWTLSRYAQWLIDEHERAAAEGGDGSALLPRLVDALLRCVLDRNKRVQEAACSAMATLEEEATLALVPYLQPILQTLLRAYASYQAKNLHILYDAIGTLADAVGAEIARPELLQLLMPPLMERWSRLPDDHIELLPLLETLTAVAQALGLAFQPYAEPVYARCVRMIDAAIRADAAHHAATNGVAVAASEVPDKELLVCALDLVAGVIEGLGPSSEALVARSELAARLLYCMRDSQPDVRQSAFAVVGDMAKACHRQLLPHMHDTLQLLTANLDPAFVSVCNNAIWAIGEITVQIGATIVPFADAILQHLILVLNRQSSFGSYSQPLVECAAITIGCLGMAAPHQVAPHLEIFVQSWCVVMTSYRDDVEKEHAFSGLVAMLAINPNGPINCILNLFAAIASWERPPPQLAEPFRQILYGYKARLPAEQWAHLALSFPANLVANLREGYGIHVV